MRKVQCTCGAWHTGHHRTPPEASCGWPYHVSHLCAECYFEDPPRYRWAHADRGCERPSAEDRRKALAEARELTERGVLAPPAF